MKLTKEIIEQGVKFKGYKWFETGDYNINIVGVRNSNTGTEVTNKFDDKITLSFKCDDQWEFYGSHKIRLHQGRYEALGQNGPVTVYRDANKDNKFDLSDDNTQTGLFGINIHRATKWGGKKSSQVDKWSAGCQVIAANDDWHEFMDICRVARDKWSNSFTYTLLDSKDLKL
jgi:flagellar hook-associated protein FlgK